MMRAATLFGMAGAILFATGLPGVAAGEALQPYQLVRSLQLVQDRIAGGDHAALPMQGKLLEMIDARLRAADSEDFKDPKNFRALLVYGMSGGNPLTVEAATSRVELDAQNRAIATGVIAYLNGRPKGAIDALKSVDPMTLPSDLGAFVALVRGSLLSTLEPARALALLDQARLLSPGTLVEEAALRRSVAIAAAQGDAARFALASTQYVENFLYSPYASQFADAFVSGVISLHMAISQDKVADITSMMDPEREKVIYLRIARRAAIDGLNDLSAFASARAEQGRGGNGNGDDPRALLYASLSTVTSDTMEDVRARLKKIDRSKLSEGDRALLDAAEAVVEGVLMPPAAPAAAVPAASDRPAPVTDEAPAATAEGQPIDATGLPLVEGAMPDAAPAAAVAAPAGPPASSLAVPTASAEPAPASSAVSSAAPAAASSAPPASAAASVDPADATMVEARHQLELVDQMLGAAPK